MEKNKIFTFKDSNGIEVTGVVVLELPSYDTFMGHFEECIVYVKNKLAFYHYNTSLKEGHIGGIIVEYAIIPELDNMLNDYNDIEVAKAETAAGM